MMSRYCGNCGKEISDNWKFCIYCGEIISDDYYTVPEGSLDSDVNLENMLASLGMLLENATEPANIGNVITLCQGLGDAYQYGRYGADKNEKNALNYYLMGARFGDVACMREAGFLITLMHSDDEDPMIMTLGVSLLIDSFKRGYEGAREILEMMVIKGFFGNCSTLNDLLNMTTLAENVDISK